jgi:serine/threonine protein kinase
MQRALLEPGTRVRAEQSGVTILIGERLGGGGQGEVYVADMGGYPMAVKWYFPHQLAIDPRLRARLNTAVVRGSPSRAFLWPADLTVLDGNPGFGYVMPLREKRFQGFEGLMDFRLSPSARVLATAAYELAEGYLTLHAKGLCYMDISFGNVALDPDLGEVRICDNDNVDVDKTPGSVIGTPMFMAPEIVAGRAGPSIRTDLWSLSVLLFYAFIRYHPLLGRHELDFPILGRDAQAVLFGRDACFIYDPNNHSNEPVPGVHDHALLFWPMLPTFLRKLFTQAFTDGLRDPGSRVLEAQWRDAMVLLRDSILRCPGCRAANFVDTDIKSTRTCFKCQGVLPQPRCITIGTTRVIMSDDATLFPHHLDPTRSRLNFSAPLAVFSRNPAQPNRIGLKNLGPQPWHAISPDGVEHQIDSGRSVPLEPGVKIGFGRVEGVVG